MFKRSVFTLSVLSITLSAFALGDVQKFQPAASKPNLAPTEISDDRTGGSAADLLNQTHVDFKPTPSKRGVQVSVVCTDSYGKSLMPEDAGYNQCITEAQSKSVPGAPVIQNTQTKPGVGFKFGQ